MTKVKDLYKECATFKIGTALCRGIEGDKVCTYCPVLKDLSLINPVPEKNVRDYNVGKSNYSEHKIQPWDIWAEYNLDPWRADIIKRVLRFKEGDSERLDFEKIKHICDEIIRQIDLKKK